MKKNGSHHRMVPGDGDLGEDAQEQAAPVRLKGIPGPANERIG